jgi:hypothetical protein
LIPAQDEILNREKDGLALVDENEPLPAIDCLAAASAPAAEEDELQLGRELRKRP